MRRGILTSVILIFSLLLSLSSCSRKVEVEYCELGIILTSDFDPYDSNGAFDVAYADGELIVGFMRYSFVDSEEYGFLSTLTPQRFAEVYLAKFPPSDKTKLHQHGDVPYYSYSLYDSSGFEYFYLLTFYRTPYAYFVITFITPSDKADAQMSRIFDFVETVYILEEHI